MKVQNFASLHNPTSLLTATEEHAFATCFLQHKQKPVATLMGNTTTGPTDQASGLHLSTKPDI